MIDRFGVIRALAVGLLATGEWKGSEIAFSF